MSAVGAGVIYRAVTLQQAGRRRRSAAGGGEDRGAETWSRLQDLVMLGGCGHVVCHVSRVTCHVTVLCEQGWRRWRKPSTDKQRMGNSLIYFISSIMSVINIILEINNFDRIC